MARRGGGGGAAAAVGAGAGAGAQREVASAQGAARAHAQPRVDALPVEVVLARQESHCVAWAVAAAANGALLALLLLLPGTQGSACARLLFVRAARRAPEHDGQRL